MREIKFRGLAIDGNGNSEWFYYGTRDKWDIPLKYQFVKVYDLQYTGLKDKNGAEIYEGDIVEYKDYSGGAYLVGKQPISKDSVKWNSETGGYAVRGMGWTFKAHKYEVIGNVYEHPHLLGSEKE